MKRNMMLVAALLVGLLVATMVAGCEPPGGAKKNPDAVKAEFFVMSQCPYGVQVVNAVKDVVDKMGPDLDFSIDFIGNKDAQGNLTSMHGPDEVTGDIVQLCAAKYAPAKYLDMIVCQNKNSREVAKNWEKCAQDAKLPVGKIRSCLNGPEGKQLLQASFDRAAAKKASGSPTILVAGKPYNGRRSTTDFFRSFCNEHKGAKKPMACANIPESPKVNVIVLGDKRCTDCNTERYVGMLKFRIANPVVKEIDYGTPDGKKVYEDAKLTNLPAILFDSTLDADKEASGMFGRNLKPAGQYKNLDVGASWNPVCMSEGGCDLEACKSTMACRKEIPNKLEVFVMSQCPYGVKALNAMEEVLKNFGGKVDFSINYIGNKDAAGKLSSMHGQDEVDEDVRELCAIKHFGKGYKFMDYILCRNKEIRSKDWEKCATGGVDAKKIKTCSEGEEGKKLLEENFGVAGGLGIGASPTWLANSKFKFSGIDAETIRKNVCDHNKDLKGCENKLSGPEGGGGPAKGGCGQ